MTGRLSTTNLHGFQAYWTFGHTWARYFPPETGGLAPQGSPLVDGVFRYRHKDFEWVAFTWRYDSGLVVCGVQDADAALSILSPPQQTSIGLSCGSQAATFGRGLTVADCAGQMVGSKLLTLPQAGAENDDHHSDRVRPRQMLNVGIGSDNLFHTENRRHFAGSIEIANLTNQVALCNFLSTFSGTHFLQPRTVVARIGFVFCGRPAQAAEGSKK